MPEFSLGAHRFQALLFDLDGTLVESIADIHAAAARAMQQFGASAPSALQLRDMVGRGANYLLAKLWQHHFQQAASASEQQALYAVFIQQYAEQGANLSHLYPGCAQLLQALQQHKIPVALCTNKPHAIARRVLQQLNIEQYFAHSFGADSVANAKPAADMLNAAAAALGVANHHCLMVGDSFNDIGAARAANMRVVALGGGYNHGDDIAEQGADFYFSSLAEFAAVLSF